MNPFPHCYHFCHTPRHFQLEASAPQQTRIAGELLIFGESSCSGAIFHRPGSAEFFIDQPGSYEIALRAHPPVRPADWTFCFDGIPAAGHPQLLQVNRPGLLTIRHLGEPYCYRNLLLQIRRIL